MLPVFQEMGVSLQSQEFGPVCVIMSETIVVFVLSTLLFLFLCDAPINFFLAYPVDYELQVSFTSLNNKALQI